MNFKFTTFVLILFILTIIFFTAYTFFDSINTNNSSLYPNSQPNQATLQLTNPNSNYKVYFCPEDDCNSVLYNLFEKAKTIDCAVYDIKMDWIYSILNTKDKKVRLIEDDYQLSKTKISANISDLSEKQELRTDKSKKYMHNKFCIFDSNILLIGSTNFTEDAIKNQNNNFIVTDNNLFVKELQSYFNNLWQGNFTKGFSYKNACFSPNNCINYYINEAENAKKSIKCMFFSFTNKDFEKELEQKKQQGLDVKIIMEKSQNSHYSQYKNLENDGINVIWDKNPHYMHNKFCIFDNNTIITGSMNMSNNGNYNNNESIILINNKDLASKYESYFDKYFTEWS